MAGTTLGLSGVTYPDASIQTTAYKPPPAKNIQVINATGTTWTKPSGGQTWAVIEAWGGGGGGTTGGQGGGGGSGAYTSFLIPLANLPSTLSPTIGGGGSGGYSAGGGGTTTVSWSSGSSYLGFTSITAAGGGGGNFYSGSSGSGGAAFTYSIPYCQAYFGGTLVTAEIIAINGIGGSDMSSGGYSVGVIPASLTGNTAGTGGSYGSGNGAAGKVIISCF